MSDVARDGRGIRLEHQADGRSAVVAIAEANGGVATLVEERRSLEEVFRDLISVPAA